MRPTASLGVGIQVRIVPLSAARRDENRYAHRRADHALVNQIAHG